LAAYLVTGGAGFIGSHVIQELITRGASVTIADDFSTGRRDNLPRDARCRVVEGDLAEMAVAARAVAGADYVIHLAAMPSVPRSVQDPLRSHRANVDATLNVLLAARDARVRRVVFAGSSAAYGNTDVLPKHEDMPSMPLSPYALQKVIGEQYCQMFTKLYGLETVTTRYFNVYGPRQQPGSPYSGVISLFIEALAAGRPPTVHGDGRQTRDFTYVSDVVTGVLQACHAQNVSGEIINVAAGGRVSLLELIRTLQAILRTEVAPVFGPSREGDVRDSQADIAKARKLLSFSPTVPLDEGLRATVQWFQSQTPARS
jgi:UDP-N-acetylglucosamine/UDP-N-acetyl-alpha-D-glucosaminouronate 4-epimerase